MKDQKNFELPELIWNAFCCHFHVLNLKKHALSLSHLTVTLWLMSNNCRSASSIGFVHTQLILQWVYYSPDEEIDCDITCGMIDTIFSSFLLSELYSPLASSVSK
jgi:hypothetical protein